MAKPGMVHHKKLIFVEYMEEPEKINHKMFISIEYTKNDDLCWS